MRLISANDELQKLSRYVEVNQAFKFSMTPDDVLCLIVDAAMNDLVRPSLYDAWHEIEHVGSTDGDEVSYDIVGPVCESADTFARARGLPRCNAGDLLMIRNTGAYGTSMASTFNSRPLIAEVLLDDGRYAVVRRRQTIDELVAGERVADTWCKA